MLFRSSGFLPAGKARGTSRPPGVVQVDLGARLAGRGGLPTAGADQARQSLDDAGVNPDFGARCEEGPSNSRARKKAFTAAKARAVGKNRHGTPSSGRNPPLKIFSGSVFLIRELRRPDYYLAGQARIRESPRPSLPDFGGPRSEPLMERNVQIRQCGNPAGRLERHIYE